MEGDDDPIPPSAWRAIVANVPICSVDLVVEHNGGVLLGKREYEPAKGEWFVPGGTVLKNEPRRDAAHRIAEEELGEPIVIEKRLGTFEHFYETSDVAGIDSKHYVSTAFRCSFARDDPSPRNDEQHSQLEIFSPPFENLHRYVECYLELL